MAGRVRLCALSVFIYLGAWAQVIEFESGGLKYQTLTRSDVTIMFARMPTHMRDFSILQVAVSNGSHAPYVIRPEDFRYTRGDGSVTRGAGLSLVRSVPVARRRLPKASVHSMTFGALMASPPLRGMFFGSAPTAVMTVT